MSDLVIRFEGIGKMYQLNRPAYREMHAAEFVREIFTSAWNRLRRLRQEEHASTPFWALRDISFEVKQGELLGVIGRNGAGKSTLLKILSRVTQPTEGRFEYFGRLGSLLEVGLGFISEMTGRENIYMNGAILGMTRKEIAAKYNSIVEFAEIEQFIDVPVKRYSSGMTVRLAFAIAAFIEPEILVLDEVLSVGDMAFQQKSMRRMQEILHDGRTVLFVSHDLRAVRELCTRTVVLEHGRIVFMGDTATAIDVYTQFNQAGDAVPATS